MKVYFVTILRRVIEGKVGIIISISEDNQIVVDSAGGIIHKTGSNYRVISIFSTFMVFYPKITSIISWQNEEISIRMNAWVDWLVISR